MVQSPLITFQNGGTLSPENHPGPALALQPHKCSSLSSRTSGAEARSCIGGRILSKPCESVNSHQPVELNYRVTSLGMSTLYTRSRKAKRGSQGREDCATGFFDLQPKRLTLVDRTINGPLSTANETP